MALEKKDSTPQISSESVLAGINFGGLIGMSIWNKSQGESIKELESNFDKMKRNLNILNIEFKHFMGKYYKEISDSDKSYEKLEQLVAKQSERIDELERLIRGKE